MPVFTLTKYTKDKKPEDPAKEEGSDQAKDTEDPKEFTTISASEPVSKVVALALHKRLQNVKEEQEEKPADTTVISTEEINENPVQTYNRVKTAKQVVILNKGFRTKQEDWLLMSLESQGKKVFYSIESFLDSLVKKGVLA